MATVSAPRRSRQSAPLSGEITLATVPEGWQRGGAAPPPVPAERHGKCSLTLRIGGTDYRLRPMPPHGEIRTIWTLRKIQPDPLAAPVAYCVASDGQAVHCTCPDHEHNSASCKHMMALIAIGLVSRPAPPPRPETRPRAARPKKTARRSVRRPADPAPVICLECDEVIIDESPDPAFCATCFDGMQTEGGAR